LEAIDPPNRDEQLAGLDAVLSQTQERLRRLEAKSVVSPKPESVAQQLHDKAVGRAISQAQLDEEFLARSRSFPGEARDDVWANSEEPRLVAAAKSAIPENINYKIESAVCRTGTCKMLIAHTSLSDRDSFSLPFGGELGQQPDIAGVHYQKLEPRPDGTFPMEILTFRRGYPMPGIGESR
jgi:hypothetical protein